MKYEISEGKSSLFTGLAVWFLPGAFIGGACWYFFGDQYLGFWIIPLLGIITSGSSFLFDFDKIPKDHIGSIVDYGDEPVMNRLSGYVWLKIRSRKVGNILEATQIDSTQNMAGAITKKGDEGGPGFKVNCKFKASLKIVDVLLLEETLGIKISTKDESDGIIDTDTLTNFLKELADYRYNKYEEYIRSVSLDTLETPGADDLSIKLIDIVNHHRAKGIEIVGAIEIFDIKAEKDAEREEINKEKARQKVKAESAKGLAYRIDYLYLLQLVLKGEKTASEYMAAAKILLLEGSTEAAITEKAVKLAEANVPDEEERKEMREKAVLQDQIENNQAKRSVFEGLEDSKTMKNI